MIGDFCSKECFEVQKVTQNQIHEVQQLIIPPTRKVELHGHDNLWEAWLWLGRMEAYICLKDEQHSLTNNTGIEMKVMAIKGSNDCTYEELESFFGGMGFKVLRGSIDAR